MLPLANREKDVLGAGEGLTLSTPAGCVSQDCSLDAFTTSSFRLIRFFQSSSPLRLSSATLRPKQTQSHCPENPPQL